MNSKEIYFSLHPVNFLVISGLIQNFILAGILFFKSSDRRLANRLLALTIVIVNAHLTYLMLLDTNLDNLFPWVLSIPYSFLSAVGPMIWFYTKSLTDLDFTVSTISLKHFIPLAVEVGLQMVMIVQGNLDGELFYNTPMYFYVTPVMYAWAAGSIFYYLRRSLGIIHNHEAWVLRNFSNLKEVTLAWLSKLIIYYRVLWIVWVPFVATFLLFFRFQLQLATFNAIFIVVVLALYLLILTLVYLTFWIGLEGMKQGNVVVVKPHAEKAENKNYTRLTPTEIQHHLDRINELMATEKAYLNENLNLRDFALQLNTDPNLVSFLLNNHLNSNFYDFVNRYRIEEVKTRLRRAEYNHLSLLGIALESGFNSKTTFNRVFKQVTGITPTEFQKQIVDQ